MTADGTSTGRLPPPELLEARNQTFSWRKYLGYLRYPLFLDLSVISIANMVTVHTLGTSLAAALPPFAFGNFERQIDENVTVDTELELGEHALPVRYACDVPITSTTGFHIFWGFPISVPTGPFRWRSSLAAASFYVENFVFQQPSTHPRREGENGISIGGNRSILCVDVKASGRQFHPLKDVTTYDVVGQGRYIDTTNTPSTGIRILTLHSFMRERHS
ncbi:MAG: hypothetical protein Q9183_004692 [Haloplaca sp. 2 TL-2023]